MAGAFLQRSRHGTVFYFRRRVPDDLRAIAGRPYVVKSLATERRQLAIVRARALASQTDQLFQEWRGMAKSSDPIRADFSLEYFTDDNGRERVKPVDIKAGEGLDAAIATATLQAHLDGKPLPMYAPPPADRPRGMPFKDAVEYYITTAEVKVSTKTVYLSRLEHALKFFGENKDARHIEQSDLMDYKKHIVAKLNKGSQAVVIGQLVTMLNAVRHDKTWGNPLTAKRVTPKKEQKPPSKDRSRLTLDHLDILFKNAKQYKDHKKWQCKYWLTIALPFFGCRITELCQINLASELLQDEKSGVWFINIQETEDDDGVTRVSVKNIPSWRMIPIHSALVRHGFIDFLHEQKRQGATRPFEKTWSVMEMKAPVFGSAESEESKPPVEIQFNWGKRAINWASRELKALRESGTIENGKFTYNHSMRHAFSNALVSAKVPFDFREASMGHEYGSPDAERYAELKESPALLSEYVYEPGLVNLAALLDKLWKEDSPAASQEAHQSI